MINEDQYQKLRLTLSTSGWNDVIKPAYEARGRMALKALVLSASERAKAGGEFANVEDGDLRAIIRECEWMTAVWQNELNVFEMNRRGDELARQEAQNGLSTLPANP
jgi:hypothetical protein